MKTLIRCYLSVFPHPGWGKGERMMTKLKIEGMTCNHCVMGVKKALQAVPGVKGVVEVSLGTPEVQALIAAVVDEGYAASVLT